MVRRANRAGKKKKKQTNADRFLHTFSDLRPASTKQTRTNYGISLHVELSPIGISRTKGTNDRSSPQRHHSPTSPTHFIILCSSLRSVIFQQRLRGGGVLAPAPNHSESIENGKKKGVRVLRPSKKKDRYSPTKP